MHRLVVIVGFGAVLSACGADAPPPTAGVPPPQPPPSAASVHAPAATPDTNRDAPAFVDKVWRVAPGSGVEAGTTYAFLHDGTLVVIDAPHGTPGTGAWHYLDGRLTMVEEGVAYPTDIVALDAAHFVIRSHNPGGAVVIAMVADTNAPLPQR